MTNINIYKYDRKIETNLKRLAKANINENNRKQIKEFYNNLVATSLSKARIVKYMQSLIKLAEWVDMDFKEMTKKDVQSLIAEINTKNYSHWTVHDYSVIIKVFFRWLYSGSLSGEYPKVVDWVNTTIAKNNNVLPEDMLTEDDIRKMIEVGSGARDKAFISVLYDSGCRIGELLKLKVKHVKFDDSGAVIQVRGKTGSRRVRIVGYAPILQTWLRVHPRNTEPDAPLWTSKNDSKDYLRYRRANYLLKEMAQESGVKKDVNPHAFRHARASFLANHLTEAQMCEFFGWKQGSQMPSIYVHLSGRDLDNAILGVYGEPQKKKVESQPQPIRCPRCKTFNGADQSYCVQCDFVLDQTEALKQESKNADKFEQVEQKYNKIKTLLFEIASTIPEADKKLMKRLKTET